MNHQDQALIESFYDPHTSTISYVVYDRVGGHGAIIDPVLDYAANSGHLSLDSVRKLLQFIQAQHLKIDWILETHAHADHLSAAQWLKEQTGAKIAIGEHISTVQQVFKTMFNLGEDCFTDGRPFDYLFKDGETFNIGSLQVQAIWVPGHTPADMAYKTGHSIFVGDTLFMPDVGTARCDFPGGDAGSLYDSIQKLLALPSETRLFMCHDYPPSEREPRWVTTVGIQRAVNIHVHDAISREDFIALRNERDATLDLPVLILPSIQVNIRAGTLPALESNGVSYLKIPLKLPE
ncbi:MAG: MBL fold metallo-hydrolase [Azovibrio sp.]